RQAIDHSKSRELRQKGHGLCPGSLQTLALQFAIDLCDQPIYVMHNGQILLDPEFFDYRKIEHLPRCLVGRSIELLRWRGESVGMQDALETVARLCPLADELFPMRHEGAQLANGLRGNPDLWNKVSQQQTG